MNNITNFAANKKKETNNKKITKCFSLFLYLDQNCTLIVQTLRYVIRVFFNYHLMRMRKKNWRQQQQKYRNFIHQSIKCM